MAFTAKNLRPYLEKVCQNGSCDDPFENRSYQVDSGHGKQEIGKRNFKNTGKRYLLPVNRRKRL